MDENGNFTKDVAFFAGQFVFNANDAVIEKLRELGALLGRVDIEHSYPHCWRCKNPIIFRSTEQWFISMERNALRHKALQAIDQVKWIPVLGARPDLRHDRKQARLVHLTPAAWGVPLPFFIALSAARSSPTRRSWIMSSSSSASSAPTSGSSARLRISCPWGRSAPCGAGRFEKEMDILDVWFDSGVSHAAVMEHDPDLDSPADMYLEGSDQHRGWFHSSLLASVGTRGKAPYRSVLTHGFVVDGQAERCPSRWATSSAPGRVIEKHGAEILRLWVAAEDYRDDIRISPEILDRLSRPTDESATPAAISWATSSDFEPGWRSSSIGEMPKRWTAGPCTGCRNCSSGEKGLR